LNGGRGSEDEVEALIVPLVQAKARKETADA
jgi:hypothetical protein